MVFKLLDEVFMSLLFISSYEMRFSCLLFLLTSFEVT
jgi:hypothetical protein